MTTNELLQEITGTVRTNGSGSITGSALQKVLTDMAGASIFVFRQTAVCPGVLFNPVLWAT